MAGPLTDTKRTLIELLKRSDGERVSDLANRLGLTHNAIRQHLEGLETNGLVQRLDAVSPGGRGRPSNRWTLTPLATELFPDRHRDLTVDLISSIRNTLGEPALTRVVHDRSQRQLASYRSTVPGPTSGASLGDRVQALADARSAEGYMAEVIVEEPRIVTLIEHHCPISSAAEECLVLCAEELDVFRAALGSDVAVERTTHLLSGDRRCTYRVSIS